LSFGFIQSKADYSLFTLQQNAGYIAVFVYVDDLLFTGSNLSLIQQFKTHLYKWLHMKDLGDLKYFLRIEVVRSKQGIFLSQRKYVLDLLKETGMSNTKPVYLPMDPNMSLSHEDGELMSAPDKYRRLVGKLIYLTITRPDITYTVHVLSQFMQAPTITHYTTAFRVLRYLKNYPGQGVLLSSAFAPFLNVYCDSDWGRCPDSRKSVTVSYLVIPLSHGNLRNSL